METYQPFYRQAAEENHALLAEVGQWFYALSPTLHIDAANGVHPNEAGRQLAAEAIAEVLLNRLIITKSQDLEYTRNI